MPGYSPMSNETSGDNNSVPLAEVEQIVNEVPDDNPLKPIVVAQQQQIQQLQDSKAEEVLEIRGDEENPSVGDIWIAGQPIGKIVNGNRNMAKSAEKQARAAESSDSEPTDNNDDNGADDDLLPIERLLRGENRDDWYVGNATESVERAKELFRHFQNWSSTTQKGRVIKTSGGKRGTATLKLLLNTALDGPKLSWKQVYRACQKLEKWTNGTIQFIDHRRHGKMLVMNKPRRKHERERASSVGTG